MPGLAACPGCEAECRCRQFTGKRSRQIVQQDAPGDAIDDQVMDRHGEDAGPVFPGEPCGAAQRPFGKVPAFLYGDRPIIQVRQTINGERQGCRAVHQPLSPALGTGAEAQAERVMRGGDAIKCRGQLRRLYRAGHVQPCHLVPPRRPLQAKAEEPLLDRRQRHLTHSGGGIATAAGRLDRHIRQLAQRLVQEDLTRGQRQPAPSCAGDDLEGEDAVAAEREEVVVAPDRGTPSTSAPDPPQRSLGGRRPARRRRRRCAASGGGQGRAVELAVGG